MPSVDWRSYGTSIVFPSDPTAITYAVAFVDNTELTADKTGLITGITNIEHGHFSDNVISDLQQLGRNLLVFIHGFDNSFEAAISRAAVNREWFAQSGVPGADTTVIAFSWPSWGDCWICRCPGATIGVIRLWLANPAFTVGIMTSQ